MALPQRSLSQTVRVPRFLRTSTVVRPATFGPGAQLMEAEAVPTTPAHSSVVQAPVASSMITMPSAPSQPATEAGVPDILMEDPIDASAEQSDDGGDSSATNEMSEEVDSHGSESEFDNSEDNKATEDNDSDDTSSSLSPEVLVDLQLAMRELENVARRDALALGLAVAQRLVGLTIHADEDALRTLIDDAFTRLSAASVLEVRLHPDDIAMLQSDEEADGGETALPEADQRADQRAEQSKSKEETKGAGDDVLSAEEGARLNVHRRDASLHFVSDDSLARGEMMVQSDIGDIDATLDARILAARAVLETIE